MYYRESPPLKHAHMLTILFCLGVFPVVRCKENSTYRGAVYEHRVVFFTNRSEIATRKQALDVINTNLAVYAQQASLAAKQNTRIIVFPEYGLIGIGWNRKTIFPYLEYVSDPKTQHWIPCKEPDRYPNTETQRALSCIAANHSMYVVASMAAIDNCSGSDCPPDGHNIYSTVVVYDEHGIFIARYCKQNVNDNEDYLNVPTSKQEPYFYVRSVNATFGILSSQDIFGEHPLNELMKMNVSNIVYPNAWVDELPLRSSIGMHSSFAQGLRVNLLSANLHLPEYGMQGSGIYGLYGLTSLGGVYEYNATANSTGELLVHDVTPIQPLLGSSLSRRFPMSQLQETHSSHDSKLPSDATFWTVVNGDRFKMIPVREFFGSPSVCHNTLCCSTFFEGQLSHGELFALGAFDDLHTKDGRYHLQACILIKCAAEKTDSCGQPTTSSNSYMSKMSFSGNFSSSNVMPEVLVTYDNNRHIVTSTWLYQDAILIDVGVPGGPLTIAMMSRDNK